MHFFRSINRSIVTKTATLIFVVVSLLVIALLLTSHTLVLNQFTALEQEDAKVQIKRAENEIKATLDKLQTFASDWSSWDDSFQFVDDHNPAFIKNNLIDQMFIDQRLNLMMFFDIQGQLVHQQFFNLANAKPSSPDSSTLKAIQAVPQLVRNVPGSSEIQTGILITPAAPLLLVSSRMLPSLRNESSRGKFVIGRYLDPDEIERISALTQLKLSVHPVQPPSPGETQPAIGRFLTEIVNENTLLASTVLTGISGQPALTATISLARTIFQQGYAMWKQQAVAAALLAFFFVVVLVLLLNRIVLRKLVRMTHEIDQIKEKGDPGQGVTVLGQDELAYLAEKINAMLATLQRLRKNQEERELYLQRMLDTVNCGIMVVAAEDRHIITINKAAAAMFGRHPEDVIGRSCHAFVCPKKQNDCPVLDRKEQIELSEQVILRADQSELPVLKSVAGIESDGHQYLIESFVDISPLKRAEAELRASEARYRRFFDEDFTGDFIISATGEIIDCNLAYARMFGHETIDAIKRTNAVAQYAVATDWDAFLEKIRREGKLERYESELRQRDGRPIHCIGNQIGEFDDQRALIRIRGYLFDDTKRVLLEQEIRQNQKMEAIGTLAGGIAHDFNNILAGIIGYTEIILLQESADNRVREYLRKILAASEKARDLIYQILAFSRKTETTVQPVELAPVIREVMQMLRATLPATITIEERFHADAIVMADPVQIQQIVLNICTNASHAMRDAGGTLTVGCERVAPPRELLGQNPALSPGDHVRIRIDDTGHGIPEAIRNRIFDPFFTTKGKNEGTGLGLSVVHGIVQSLRGVITIASPPGLGTRFDVYLPLAGKAADVPMPKPLPPSSGEEHIVYVDDDPFLVEIGTEILQGLGYRVTGFTNSSQALAFLRAQPGSADLVISDLAMPRLTGIGLARGLREAGVATPMIIYTGYGEDLASEDHGLLGIREVLLKPVTPHVLAGKVREVLDRVRRETGFA